MAEVFVEHPPHADGQTALLYKRYGMRIYRFCLSRLRCREEAEDAVQSTFLRAHGALRQGVVPHSESAWLFKIAQNVCVTRAVASSRRTRVEHAADLEQVNERVPAAHHPHDELFGLADALSAMPPNLRRAFLLREWKGLSYAEIAEDLGVSQSAVETLIFRARRHLAGALDVPTSRLRRAVKALHLGPLLDLMRGLIAGGGAKVAAVAAVATVGAVGVTVVPGSQSRPPAAPAGVTPNELPGAASQPAAGTSRATQSSSRTRPNGRAGAGTGEGKAAGPASPRSSGGRLAGTSEPTSAAPRAGTPAGAGAPSVAGPTTAAPNGNPSGTAPSANPTAGTPSGSNGVATPPVVAVPPVTPPSGSGGLPEVPIPPLPPVPGVPIPQVPQVPPVPVPQVPPVTPPTVPPLPSLTPPPVPVTPPSVPPVPPVPPLPQPPPVPQVIPPPPPVPVPPVLPPLPPPPPLP